MALTWYLSHGTLRFPPQRRRLGPYVSGACIPTTKIGDFEPGAGFEPARPYGSALRMQRSQPLSHPGKCHAFNMANIQIYSTFVPQAGQNLKLGLSFFPQREQYLLTFKSSTVILFSLRGSICMCSILKGKYSKSTLTF